MENLETFSGKVVKDPVDFVRRRAHGWRKDIGVIRGALVYLMLQSEMKVYGYKW